MKDAVGYTKLSILPNGLLPAIIMSGRKKKWIRIVIKTLLWNAKVTDYRSQRPHFFQVQGHQHPRAVKNIYGKKKMDKLKLNGMIIYFFELNLTNKDTSICAKEAYHLMEGKKFKGKESRKLQGRLIIKIIRQPKRRRL